MVKFGKLSFGSAWVRFLQNPFSQRAISRREFFSVAPFLAALLALTYLSRPGADSVVQYLVGLAALLLLAAPVVMLFVGRIKDTRKPRGGSPLVSSPTTAPRTQDPRRFFDRPGSIAAAVIGVTLLGIAAYTAFLVFGDPDTKMAAGLLYLIFIAAAVVLAMVAVLIILVVAIVQASRPTPRGGRAGAYEPTVVPMAETVEPLDPSMPRRFTIAYLVVTVVAVGLTIATGFPPSPFGKDERPHAHKGKPVDEWHAQVSDEQVLTYLGAAFNREEGIGAGAVSCRMTEAGGPPRISSNESYGPRGVVLDCAKLSTCGLRLARVEPLVRNESQPLIHAYVVVEKSESGVIVGSYPWKCRLVLVTGPRDSERVFQDLICAADDGSRPAVD